MRSSRIVILIFFILLSGLFSKAQTKELSEAENLFLDRNFSGAIPIYLRLLKSFPAQTNINYNIGICYLNSRSQKTKAAYHFEKTVQANSTELNNASETKNEPVILYKLLGDAYCYANKFDPAIASYQKYKETLLLANSKDSKNLEAVESKIQMCRIGKELRQSISVPLNLSSQIFFRENTGKISSSASLFAGGNYPRMSDSLILPGDLGTTEEDKLFFEESNFIIVNDSINSKKADQNNHASEMDTIAYATNIGASVDGQIVLTYKNENGNANLYVARLKKDQWSVPEKLNKTVNLKGWENNEFLSPDGNTMYFTSDRAGGFGKKDIYKCAKTVNGGWSKAVNLGPGVNSIYDDEAPFIHPDGVTLFFSSDRNKVGSFEIFSVMRSDTNAWANMINVGYPVNRNNESFFQVQPDKKIKNSETKDVQQKIKNQKKDSVKVNATDDKDNFLITFADQKRLPLTLLKNEVQDFPGGLPLRVEITVSDNLSETIEGIYHSDNKTGRYAFIIPPGKNNNITYELKGYLFQSENLDVNKETGYFQKRAAIKMPTLVAGSKVILNNVFFDSGKASIHPASIAELKRITRLLSENPGMKIEISNYIYAKKNKRSNKKLSKERANSIINYLFDNGVSKENVVAKGFYKSKVRVKKNTEDEGRPVITDQRAELKILEVK